jgi:hypothetical protein
MDKNKISNPKKEQEIKENQIKANSKSKSKEKKNKNLNKNKKRYRSNSNNNANTKIISKINAKSLGKLILKIFNYKK